MNNDLKAVNEKLTREFEKFFKSYNWHYEYALAGVTDWKKNFYVEYNKIPDSAISFISRKNHSSQSAIIIPSGDMKVDYVYIYLEEFEDNLGKQTSGSIFVVPIAENYILISDAVWYGDEDLIVHTYKETSTESAKNKIKKLAKELGAETKK